MIILDSSSKYNLAFFFAHVDNKVLTERAREVAVFQRCISSLSANGAIKGSVVFFFSQICFF